MSVASYTEACGATGTCVPQAGTTQRLDSLSDRCVHVCRRAGSVHRGDDFEAFLKSVELTDEGPKWQLPEGWEADPTPVRGRFATIKVSMKSKPADLTISALAQQGTREQFLAANLNRWRGQMSQSNLSPRDLKSMSQVDTRSGSAYVVNISGKLKAGGMAPPFAGGGRM